MTQLESTVWRAISNALRLLPSVVFLVWLERNCSLPWLGVEWGWPWLNLLSQPTWIVCGINVALLGISYSTYALISRCLQRCGAETLLRVTALQALALLGVLGLWQNTGRFLWVLPLPSSTLLLFSALIFWGILLLGFRFRPLSLTPLSSIILASLLSPFMTLDRSLVAISLAVGWIVRRLNTSKSGEIALKTCYGRSNPP